MRRDLLALLATLVVAFALKAAQDGVKDALALIAFVVVGFILIFGSVPYTPPQPRN